MWHCIDGIVVKKNLHYSGISVCTLLDLGLGCLSIISPVHGTGTVVFVRRGETDKVLYIALVVHKILEFILLQNLRINMNAAPAQCYNINYHPPFTLLTLAQVTPMFVMDQRATTIN